MTNAVWQHNEWSGEKKHIFGPLTFRDSIVLATQEDIFAMINDDKLMEEYLWYAPNAIAEYVKSLIYSDQFFVLEHVDYTAEWISIVDKLWKEICLFAYLDDTKEDDKQRLIDECDAFLKKEHPELKNTNFHKIRKHFYGLVGLEA